MWDSSAWIEMESAKAVAAGSPVPKAAVLPSLGSILAQ